MPEIYLPDESEYTDFTDVYSKLDSVMSDVQSSFTKQREKLITDRLKQLGITFDQEEQMEKRFKDFIAERRGKELTYYYNNGTPRGLRIITFVEDDIFASDTNNRISMGFSYY